MDLTAMLLASVIVLPAFGLMLAARWAMANAEHQLLRAAGFEDMRFDT